MNAAGVIAGIDLVHAQRKLFAAEDCLRSADARVAALEAVVAEQDAAAAAHTSLIAQLQTREEARADQVEALRQQAAQQAHAIGSLTDQLQAAGFQAAEHGAQMEGMRLAEAKLLRIEGELRAHELQMLEADKSERYATKEIEKLGQLARDEEAVAGLLKKELARERRRSEELTDNIRMAQECVERQMREREAVAAEAVGVRALCDDLQARLDAATAEVAHRDRLAAIQGVEQNLLREGLAGLLATVQAAVAAGSGSGGGGAAEDGVDPNLTSAAMVETISSYVKILALDKGAAQATAASPR